MRNTLLETLDLNSEEYEAQRYLERLHGVFKCSYIKKFISKYPEKVDTLIDILGALLLVVAHPEMVKYELAGNNAWRNLSKLADAGWESMGREYIEALREVDGKAIGLLSRLFQNTSL